MTGKQFAQRCLFACFAVVALTICAPWARAQATGAIGGTVYDASGAVVPSATVTAKNVATNVGRTTQSNGDGYYVFPSMPVGIYEVQIDAAGFSTFIQNDITLQVNQTLQVDGHLKLGAATEKVVVTADQSLVQTTSTALVQVVDEKRLTELPLNGRNVLSLVTLNAGVSDSQTGNGGLLAQINSVAQGAYTVPVAINGGRSDTTSYLLDGMDHNDGYTNVSNPFPNPDAIQEFSLQTSSYDAQYGRGTGGIVNVVTKSGTNQFHGTAFEFLRNNALNAGNYFSGVDTLKRNQFGGTIGGPIVKNKTFFFFSYQGTRTRQATSGALAIAPSAAMKQGDFSEWLIPNSDNVMTGQIYDPETGDPFPNNQIPLSRMDPVSLKLLDLMPTSAGASSAYQLRYATPSVATNDNQYLAKVDHLFNDKHRISARYFLLEYNQPWQFDPANIYFAQPGQKAGTHNGGLNYTYSITPRVLNNFNFVFHRTTPVASPPSGITSDFKSLGSNVNVIPGFETRDLAISNWSGASLSLGYSGPQTSYEISNITSVVKGNHNIRFGGMYRKYRMSLASYWLSGGYASFYGDRTGDPNNPSLVNAGNAFAQFLLGDLSRWRQQSYWSSDLRLNAAGAFIQDDIRLTPKLTANVGLRWDPRLDFWENENRKRLTFVPGYHSTRFPNAPEGLAFLGDPGFEHRITKNDYNNFAPRVGFAYQVARDTVIRGAYGIFFAPIRDSINNNSSAAGQPFIQTDIFFNSGTLSAPFGSGTPMDPSPFQPTSDYVFVPLGAYGAPLRDSPTAYVQNWNLVVERQFAQSWLVRAGYVASKGTHFDLIQELDAPVWTPDASYANINERRPYSNISSLSMITPDGFSNYESLQLTLSKRFQKNFSVLANYTWSKNTDNSGPYESNPIPYDSNAFRGIADTDLPQRLVVSGIVQHPKLEKQNPVLRAAFGDWQSNIIFAIQSGAPFSVMSGQDNNLDGLDNDFAIYNGQGWKGQSGGSTAQKVAKYFNTDNFSAGTIGGPGYGDVLRNRFRGPMHWNVDYSIFKNIPITEAMKFQFRAEFFNFFNNVGLGQPVNYVTSPSFGQIIDAGAPRIIQFGGKFIF